MEKGNGQDQTEQPAGQPLAKPAPLYKKLEPEIIEQERIRLGQPYEG